jgi:BirA family biotin operon repressor/biotin-[acetyl-CoA-carboxylase] ligase
VLIDNKKLAGILVDLNGDMDGPSAAVIGVGVNLNLPNSILSNIDQPAIDLASVRSYRPKHATRGVIKTHGRCLK